MTIIRTQKRSPHRSLDQLFASAFDSPVLVVEDQKSLAGLLAAMIRERWGCEVHLAHSLEQTACLLSTQDPPYRVAVCDLNLPDAPYGEVIDLVKSADVAAIALTGSFGEDLREAILKKGVIDYVPKDSTNSFGYVTELVGRLQKITASSCWWWTIRSPRAPCSSTSWKCCASPCSPPTTARKPWPCSKRTPTSP